MIINNIDIPEVMNYAFTTKLYDEFVDAMKEQIAEELFEFEIFDDLASLCFLFERCKLKMQIGQYNAGDVIPTIFLNWKDKNMELVNDAGFSLGWFTFKMDTINGYID